MYRLVENDVDLWATSAGNVAAKNFGIILKIFQVLRFCRLPMAEGSKVGKRMWVERELGVPVEKVNLSDSKKPYGVWNGKQGLLIDDRDKYVNEFREGGGIAIKHNPDDVDNTIRQLKELGY